MANLKITAGKNLGIPTKKLAQAVYSVLNQQDDLLAEFSIVTEEEIQKLNAEFRGIDKVTDVLSFPTLNGVRGKILYRKDFKLDLNETRRRIFIGSICICDKRAKEQAKEYGHSVRREKTYLLCHGLLHLMGYDHETQEDKQQMRYLEEKIMEEIKVLR